jgi:hypothetical protein|tara:strand:- start:6159 stop:6431 length:273 start_codon:yes stop_codon:yes gene_type:complete
LWKKVFIAMPRHDVSVCLFDLLANNRSAVEIVASDWLAKYNSSEWKVALAELYTMLAKVSFAKDLQRAHIITCWSNSGRELSNYGNRARF